MGHDDAHTSNRNQAKHQHHRPTEHRRRNSGEHAPHHGKQPGQHQNHSNIAPHMARGHARHLDYAVVLRKRGERQRAERRGNHRHQPVGKHPAAQPFLKLVALIRLAGHHRRGRKVAHRLEHAQQINRARHQKRTPIKGKAILKRHGQREQRRVLQRRKIHHAHRQRGNITRHQPHRDAAHAQKRIAHTVEQQHDDQHKTRQPDILHRAESIRALRAETAAEISDANINQAQADQQHHHAAHRRRNHPFQIRQRPSRSANQKCPGKRHAQQRGEHRRLAQAAFAHT